MEKKRRNRAFKMSDSEIITILILFHLSGYRILKVFYTQMICKEWRQHFPVVLAYNRFVEHEQMVSIKLYLFLNNCCLGDCTGISIIDSTPIRVCHHKRSRRHKTFRGFATSGKGTMGGLRFQTAPYYQWPRRNRPMAVDTSQYRWSYPTEKPKVYGEDFRKTRGRQGIHLAEPFRRIVCRRHSPDHSHTQEHEELVDASTR